MTRLATLMIVAPLFTGCMMLGARFPSEGPVSEASWGSGGFVFPFKMQRTTHMDELKAVLPVSICRSTAASGDVSGNIDELQVGMNWILHGDGDETSSGSLGYVGAGLGHAWIDWEGAGPGSDSTFEYYVCAGWWRFRRGDIYGIEIKYVGGADVSLSGQPSTLNGLQLMFVFGPPGY